MKEFTKRLIKILDESIHEYAEIEVNKINFTEDVVNACKMNYCGKYNTTWTCPPGVGTLKSLKEKFNKYETAFVFTTKHQLEDSFDIEGMDKARIQHEKRDEKIQKEIVDVKYKILSASCCDICKKCAYPDNPCRFPDKAKTTVEACGIDVVNLAKDCNIKYNNGENTVTYFSIVFF